MVRIQKLKRPTKRSGYALAPGGKTEVRGLIIISKRTDTVHVDPFTPKKRKKKKK